MSAAKYDEYWRLPPYVRCITDQLRVALGKAGFKAKQSDPKYKLIELCQKAACGRTGYEHYTEAELQRCAKDRRIDVRGIKGKAIRPLLIQADDDRTFSRFLDLPPELRNRVYHFYLAEFAKFLTLPSVPPLARCSTQLKQEVGPLFLATKHIHLVFDLASVSYAKAAYEIKPIVRTRLFFLEHAKENVGEIRNFSIEVRRLVDSKAGYKLSVRGNMGDVETSQTRKTANLRTELGKVLRRVTKRQGTKKLRLSDIYDVRKAMEVVFNADSVAAE